MDKFRAEVLQMQRQIIEYIKEVIRPITNAPPVPSGATPPRPDLDIKLVDGWPWLPEPLPNVRQTGDELERLIRTYLNTHYSE